MSKEKLIRLWTTKQERAIQIIKDGNVVCLQIECTLENDKIHSYSNHKAGNSYETSHKEKPSWMIDYEPPETLFLEEFEFAEDLLKQIIKCLPNTALGLDNLTYADLKRHLSLITPDLKTIFTICGRNKRVLSDWKIALIILILKTNGNKSNLDDWRPISLLLTMYKVFMKIIQREFLPWIVSEKRLCATQKGSLPRNGLQLLKTSRAAAASFMYILWTLRIRLEVYHMI